jgi:dephospho-CoA kinase
MKVVSIVGMAGAGKSVVARVFENAGFKKVRFGDITEQEVKKRSLEINEENERKVREQLRVQYGMAAYAILNQPQIDKLLHEGDVVVDGLYSWEEYTLFKDRYGPNFIVIAVWSSPRTRYTRLANRKIRPLSLEEAVSRDKSEIENVKKGGPIAMADFTILNETSIGQLEKDAREILSSLK